MYPELEQFNLWLQDRADPPVRQSEFRDYLYCHEALMSNTEARVTQHSVDLRAQEADIDTLVNEINVLKRRIGILENK